MDRSRPPPPLPRVRNCKRARRTEPNLNSSRRAASCHTRLRKRRRAQRHACVAWTDLAHLVAATPVSFAAAAANAIVAEAPKAATSEVPAAAAEPRPAESPAAPPKAESSTASAEPAKKDFKFSVAASEFKPSGLNSAPMPQQRIAFSPSTMPQYAGFPYPMAMYPPGGSCARV